MFSINNIDILYIIDNLNISRKNGFNNLGWVDILCPLHNDKNYGSSYISNLGVHYCFSCGESNSLYSLVKKLKPSLSKREILRFLDKDYFSDNRVFQSRKIKKIEKQLKKEEEKVFLSNFLDEDFDPNKINYTKKRGFTDSFIKENSIKLCNGGYYSGYLKIPIVDKDGKLYSYEFRKCLEIEYFKKVFNTRSDLYSYREKFKNFLNKNILDLKDENVQYLKKPRVLYPKGNKINNIIWNINKLDFNKDVYICEGIPGTAKIYNIISKNVTALFGAKISKEQLDILKEFKGKKIIIPEYDTANSNMIYEISKKINNVFVLSLKEDIDDSMDEFDYFLKKHELIDGMKFLFNYYGTFNYTVI